MSSPVERVDRLRKLDRLDDAEREARTALADDPGNVGMLCALAIVLLDAHRHDEGLAVAGAAAGAPDEEHPHRLCGLLLSRLGRHPEALRAGYRAVSLAPEGVNTALGYATILRAAGRLPDALQVAQRAVSLNPMLASAHLMVADISGDLGRRAARAAYQEVLRLEPGHALARHDLAVHDLHSGRAGRALRGLIDAGVMDPTIRQVVGNIAAVSWKLAFRLRLGFIAATMATLATAAGSPWLARAIAGLTLLTTAAAGWWTLREVPRHTGPALRAALRSSVGLILTSLVLAGCVAVFLLVLVTGQGGFAGLNIPLYFLLALLAVIVGASRRQR